MVGWCGYRVTPPKMSTGCLNDVSSIHQNGKMAIGEDQRDHGVEADPGQARAHRTVFRSMRTATSISSMTIASRAMSIAAAWPYWVNRNAVL